MIINRDANITDVKKQTCRADGKLIRFKSDFDYRPGKWERYIEAKNWLLEGCASNSWLAKDKNLPIVIKTILHGIREYEKVQDEKYRHKRKELAEQREENRQKSTMSAFEFRKAVWDKYYLLLTYRPYGCGDFLIHDEVTGICINNKKKSITYKKSRQCCGFNAEKLFTDDTVDLVYKKYVEYLRKPSMKEYKNSIDAIDALD